MGSWLKVLLNANLIILLAVMTAPKKLSTMKQINQKEYAKENLIVCLDLNNGKHATS